MVNKQLQPDQILSGEKGPKTTAEEAIRAELYNKGISNTAADVILQSWRRSTWKQYNSQLTKFIDFCEIRGITWQQLKTGHVLDFLIKLKDEGLGYSTISTAKSAIVNFLKILDINMKESIELKRFMKGLFNFNPPTPKYAQIWDVRLVTDYLRRTINDDTLSLKEFTIKVALLLALLSSSRLQTLYNFKFSNMNIENEAITFYICTLLKTSRPNNTGQLVVFHKSEDPALCPVRTILKYREKTSNLRENKDRFFICHKKPYAEASKDTIARWIRTGLSEAGVDTTKFKAHSVRAAASSSAKLRNVPVDLIMETAGWRNEHTLNRYYNKPIKFVENPSFQQALLRKVDSSTH
ncbi:uncharacterized protein [Antedon mediterranea]|uniref:uncharacterized protein n=1 Tax=Antedon mediterranea TaxID=105859 RepID=UPI003AF42CAC